MERSEPHGREKTIREAIQRGRDFLKSQDTAELERNGSDYKTDQELKKPQPPLVKAPMTENRIDLPRNFESLSLEDNLYQLLVKRKSSRVYTQEDMSLLQLSFLLWATQGDQVHPWQELRHHPHRPLRRGPAPL